MSHARIKTLFFFIFLIIISPGPFLIIAAAVEKPGVREISSFLVKSRIAVYTFPVLFLSFGSFCAGVKVEYHYDIP